MTAPAEELPVRYCHGCEQYDTHPRTTVIADIHNVSVDKLYHYDCLPAEHADNETLAPVVAARAEGHRGDELREKAAEYAQTIAEAPADTTPEG